MSTSPPTTVHRLTIGFAERRGLVGLGPVIVQKRKFGDSRGNTRRKRKTRGSFLHGGNDGGGSGGGGGGGGGGGNDSTVSVRDDCVGVLDFCLLGVDVCGEGHVGGDGAWFRFPE